MTIGDDNTRECDSDSEITSQSHKVITIEPIPKKRIESALLIKYETGLHFENQAGKMKATSAVEYPNVDNYNNIKMKIPDIDRLKPNPKNIITKV